MIGLLRKTQNGAWVVCTTCYNGNWSNDIPVYEEDIEFLNRNPDLENSRVDFEVITAATGTSEWDIWESDFAKLRIKFDPGTKSGGWILEDGTDPYCPQCGACGEEGCCSPMMCQQSEENGYYCQGYLNDLKFGYHMNSWLEKNLNGQISLELKEAWDHKWEESFDKFYKTPRREEWNKVDHDSNSDFLGDLVQKVKPEGYPICLDRLEILIRDLNSLCLQHPAVKADKTAGKLINEALEKLWFCHERIRKTSEKLPASEKSHQ